METKRFVYHEEDGMWVGSLEEFPTTGPRAKRWMN